MSEFLDKCAGFRCPNCDTIFNWPFVRDLLWRQQVWLFFLGQAFRNKPLYREPLRDELRCYDCLMDLHVSKRRMLLVEGLFWASFLALFVGGLWYFRQWMGVPVKPTLNATTLMEMMNPESNYRRARDASRILLFQTGLLACVLAPLSYFIARFVSYRFVRLKRKH